MIPPTARRCPHCDAAIDPSATFCTHCGNALPAIGATQLLPPTRSSVPRSSPLLWVITIAVLGVVIGLVGVLWSRLSQPVTVGMLAPSSVSSVIPATAARITSACLVPNVVGQDQGAAEGLIAGVGLQPVKSTAYNPNIAVGQVISQDPPSGTEIALCQGKVTIIVSLGSVPQPTISLPTNTLVPPTATPQLTSIPLSPTPLSGLLPFTSPDNPTTLNPIFGWQVGGSTSNAYDLNLNPGGVTLIAGRETDQKRNTNTSPLITLPYRGNFEVSVKITITPDRNWQGAGLGVRSAQDTTTWLRLIRCFANGHVINLNSNQGTNFKILQQDLPYSDSVIYFKIERYRNLFTFSYSSNGTNWIVFQKDLIFEMSDDIQIYLFALSVGNDQGIIAQFHDFTVVSK